MPFLGKVPGGGINTNQLLDAITTSGTNTFALTKDSVAYSPSSAQTLLVSLNGVTQAPIDAFTVSGSDIIFASALTSADVIDYIIVFEGNVESLNASDIAAGGITGSMLAADSVNTDQYVDDSIELVHMKANSVSTAQYVDDSIELVHMKENSVDSGQYVDGSIDTIHIDDLQVTTAKIANDAVTGAKLNPALVAGDIIYADGTDTITRLAAGTAEQVLTMNAGAPSWADIAAGLTLDTTPKTAHFTAVAGNQYLCNTTAGVFNMTLPTANVGDTIGIIDYLGTFDTNNLTLVQDVATSNEKIFRVDASGVIDSKNWSTSIKYIDSTVGWLPAGD
jgi:hypothetical protein